MAETEDKSMPERRAQVVQQLKVVAHLSTVLAGVSADFAKIYAAPECAVVNELVDMVGRRTAHQMEVLGDILNDMDAVDEDDDWTVPVFEAAHKMWPQPGPDARHSALKACAEALRGMRRALDGRGLCDVGREQLRLADCLYREALAALDAAKGEGK